MTSRGISGTTWRRSYAEPCRSTGSSKSVPTTRSSILLEVKDIYVPHAMYQSKPSYYALFENNDPTKRMLVLVNHDSDVAEYWEFSDTGMFPVDLSNEAYKLGVNYIFYALTH